MPSVDWVFQDGERIQFGLAFKAAERGEMFLDRSGNVVVFGAPASHGFTWDSGTNSRMTLSSAGLLTVATASFTDAITLGDTVTLSNGVGSNGEQFTSAGAGVQCDWTSAGSQRKMKHVYDERMDAAEVLEMMVNTPVYDFQYKDQSLAPLGDHIRSTGDVDTVYTGIMADDAPWAMHFGGKILNPISTFGHTLLAIQALVARLEELENKVK